MPSCSQTSTRKSTISCNQRRRSNMSCHLRGRAGGSGSEEEEGEARAYGEGHGAREGLAAPQQTIVGRIPAARGGNGSAHHHPSESKPDHRLMLGSQKIKKPCHHHHHLPARPWNSFRSGPKLLTRGRCRERNQEALTRSNKKDAYIYTKQREPTQLIG